MDLKSALMRIHAHRYLKFAGHGGYILSKGVAFIGEGKLVRKATGYEQES
jgi:hypothetical protein